MVDKQKIEWSFLKQQKRGNCNPRTGWSKTPEETPTPRVTASQTIGKEFLRKGLSAQTQHMNYHPLVKGTLARELAMVIPPEFGSILRFGFL